MSSGEISQPKPRHNFKADSTAFLFSTGLLPGCPRQTGQTLVFGSSLPLVGQPQKSFVFVLSSVWISSPMTMSVVNLFILKFLFVF